MSYKQQYLKASFLICTLVLLLAAASKEVLIKSLGVQLVKLPIKLQTPLDDLDKEALQPYSIVLESQIDRASLESLGTEEYLQWMLEDTDAAADSPTRYCSLFITYYTGNPDMVPHVPDECYVGGGNEFKSKKTLSIACCIPAASQETLATELSDKKDISFQHVLFTRINEGTSQVFAVNYLFHANGKYCASRTDTRTTLFDWFSKYSYFSKVEWKFFGRDSFGDTFPNEQQDLAATEKLLNILLPELEKNHWPDWESLNTKDNHSQETVAVQ